MAGRFGSVVTAMVTPFRSDHAVDLDGAQELAAWVIDNGSDSVFVVGSTGEAPTLSHTEKAELFRVVGEAIRGRGKLICGTGTYSTAETLELTAAAEKAGADGIVVVTPYYNKPPQRGLVAHFHEIADATELPIIAYNIPSRTGTRIEHDTMLRIAEKSNVVAVKDSTGDFKAISKLISEAPEGFEVYSGDDWATFGYVCLGAVGVVSVAAHLVGDQMKRMVDLIETGDVPAARKLHEDLSPLFNALFVTSNPIPVKAALDMLGRPAGPPRLPLVPATEEERARIRTALEAAGLL
ncbi:MAG TPA: 4-hydroxy-tetrahydrodipicolinate synthase [Actinomycetota bacterium]|nr:4-hydroxy-tetrahydrodipicolinate synthase [Actinomycetota bacterium]